MTESEARSYLRRLSDGEKGRAGEKVFKQVLVSSGLRYIPLCDIQNNGAPKLTGNDSVTLPDFELFGDGFSAYLDAKMKTQSIMYENRQEVRHGIDRRNWEQYVKMGVTTRKECGLGIVELFDYDGATWTGSLLAESFRNLSTPIFGFSNQAHMVYWPRKRFVDLNSYSALELIEIARGTRNADCRHGLGQMFLPPPPECASELHRFIDKPNANGAMVRLCEVCGKVFGRVVQERKKPEPLAQQQSLF